MRYICPGTSPESTVCHLTARWRAGSLAQGNTPAPALMVVASMIWIFGAAPDYGPISPAAHRAFSKFFQRPPPPLIGLGQGRTFDGGKAQVVELADVVAEANFQVPETLAGVSLAEEHGYQVQPVGEFPGFRPWPTLAVRQVVENMSRDELQ